MVLQREIENFKALEQFTLVLCACSRIPTDCNKEFHAAQDDINRVMEFHEKLPQHIRYINLLDEDGEPYT